VNGLRFLVSERFVSVIIVLNTIAIFVRGFPQAEPFELALFSVDYACCLFFVFEMFVKVRLVGWNEYVASGWNRFDAAIVIISSPLLLSPVLDLQDFAVLLLLRTGRLARFFRLLRFIPDAERVWHGVSRGLKASIGIGFAIGLYNLVLALTACYLFRDAAPAHFGDPLVSLYSLFKVFTVEGWYEIPDAIAAGVSPGMGWLTRGFFVFSVTTGGLLGLSMANAVFVDEMVMDNTNQIEADVMVVIEHLDALEQVQAEDFKALSAKLDDLKVLVEELKAQQR
jgi:voltage-gated sodium channel